MTRQTQAGRLVNLHKVSSKIGKLAAGVRVVQAATDDAGATSAELWLYGVVGGYWYGFNAASVAEQLRTLGQVDMLTVRVYSPGGDAFDGIAIGNLFRNYGGTVRIVVDSLAASAASIIALAGDEIIMSPGSQLMIHDPWLLTVGNAKELRQDADFLDKQADNMAGIYAQKTGGDPAQWRAVMTAEPDGTWYTAEEAVAAKLADRIGTVTSTSTPPAPPAEDDFDEDEMAAMAAWDLEVLVHPAALAAWQQSGAPKPPTASAGGTTQPEGAAVVDLNDTQIAALREQVGFAPDADADTIVAAVTEALTERADPPTPPAAPAVPDGHVTISAAKLADLEAAASLATTTAKSLHNKERETFLNGVRDKFLPTSRAGWEKEYDLDEAGVRAHFAAAPVLVPTSELGHNGEPETSEVDALYAAVYGDEKGA